MALPTHVHAMLGLVALCVVFMCLMQWSLSEDLAVTAALRRPAPLVVVLSSAEMRPWEANLWDSFFLEEV